jgi:death-on-curing protein
VTDYLTLDDLLSAAEAALAPTQPVVRDIGLLESALARPQASAFGVDAYHSIEEKAAALAESLARNHALIDGNKRLSWVATKLFLAMNGVYVTGPSPEAIDEFVRSVAQGHLTLIEIGAQLRKWSGPI